MIQPYKDMLRQAETDLAAARAEIERLTKERDEARAQVAAVIDKAIWQVRSSVPGHMLVGDTERVCAAVRALTPADASAALEAYGREKVREGMMRAAALFPVGSRDGEAISSTILAEMEKLK